MTEWEPRLGDKVEIVNEESGFFKDKGVILGVIHNKYTPNSYRIKMETIPTMYATFAGLEIRQQEDQQ